MAETTFFLFPEFPPELRWLIWREALPKHTGPSLFFFKQGCWRLELESHMLETGDVEMCFDHELLDDDVQFDVPLFYVSQEARIVTLSWFREHGIKIKLDENGHHIFSRSFNPRRDALYIMPERWHSLHQGNANDMEGEPFVIKSEPEHLAVSLRACLHPVIIDMLPEAMWWYRKATEFLLIIGEEPDQQRGLGQWELTTLKEGVFIWNSDSGDFEFRGTGGNNVENEAAYENVRDALRNEELLERLLDLDIQTLEIRLALVIRR
ncbi:hypothetical protein F4813DRAFT_335318 [Daldinia decipiens]|uniref:uncharacterized protein n=1 Tax=Daldinia decipiens TaxID=326647 RepID=UPI0020C3836F|nr:uncharacterized protein F4813DRAFT_335318 [Daldinia decipiens]KAI1659502.1 hypothetical protein F4813DRAFT_335318 [Daldinia decipiens]